MKWNPNPESSTDGSEEGKEAPFARQSNQPPLSPIYETEEKDKVMKCGPIGLNKNKSKTTLYWLVMTYTPRILFCPYISDDSAVCNQCSSNVSHPHCQLDLNLKSPEALVDGPSVI